MTRNGVVPGRRVDNNNIILLKCTSSYPAPLDLANLNTIPDLKEEIMDGAYLHYGRLALVYLEFDSSEAWRYDKEAKDWVELSGGDILDVRRAVRIARGQSAPGVLAAPVNLVK